MSFLGRLGKPWFVYRPRQLFLRVVRNAACAPDVRVLKLPAGFILEADVGKTIGRGLWQTGVHDLAASEGVFRLVQSGTLAVDAGANIGYMTALMALRAGPQGRVLAFEPHPALYGHLQANVARLGLHSGAAAVATHAVALSDRSGAAELFEPAGFAQNEGLATLCQGVARLVSPRNNNDMGRKTLPRPLHVLTVRLDEALEQRHVTLLKLDVEGHEAAVLRGATMALQERRITHILFEEHHGPKSTVCQMLQAAGYAIFQIGWKLRGPILAELHEPALATDYEAPSYLATLDPTTALRRLAPRGWGVLGGRVNLRLP